MANKKESTEEFDIDKLDGVSSYEDEDDLITAQDEDEEEEDIPVKSKKKLKKSTKVTNKKKSKSDEPNFLQFLMKILIPLLMLITGFIAGWLLMGNNNSDQNQPQQTNNAVVVSSINNKQTIDESVKSVQNAQLDAIREQYAGILNDTESTKGISHEDYIIASNNYKVVNDIEPMLSIMFDVTKDDTNINSFKSKITSIFKVDESSDLDKVKTQIGNKMLKQSPAKILDSKGAKAGATFASLIASNESGNASYLTITPYATDSKILNMMYLVNIDNLSGKIKDFEYIGYMDAKDKTEAKSFYEKLASLVKQGMVKEKK